MIQKFIGKLIMVRLLTRRLTMVRCLRYFLDMNINTELLQESEAWIRV
jgi:hypothetical protein